MIKFLFLIAVILFAFYYFAPEKFEEGKNQTYSVIKGSISNYFNKGLINCETNEECNERIKSCNNCSCISGYCMEES